MSYPTVAELNKQIDELNHDILRAVAIANQYVNDSDRFQTVVLRWAEYTGGHISKDEFVRSIDEEVAASLAEQIGRTNVPA